MTVTELKQNRAALIAQARQLLDRATNESRGLTAEETQQYDRIMADADNLQATIERMERQEQMEAALTAVPTPGTRPTPSTGGAPARATASDEYRVAFWNYSRVGKNGLDRQFLNALSVGSDPNGGYTVPDEFNRTLIQALEEQNIMRRLATVINSSNGTMDIPVVTAHGTAAWTAEAAPFNDSDETFGVVQLSAYKATTLIKVSEELLNDSAFNLEAYLTREFARRIGTLEEEAFVAGDGNGKPTGIVAGATAGITAAGAAAITADELIDLYHSLGRPYRANASWLMNDSTAKLLRKLKDGNSQYLWQPGLTAGEPDRILGRPVYVSRFMPAAAAGQKSVLFGDMSYYWIADRTAVTFQRLNELYSANGQVGFRAHKRVDGKATLGEAIKALTQAAA